MAKDSLDEWIYFLKNSEIKEGFKAKRLKEAREKLKKETLSDEERISYSRFQENRRIERSVTETALQEGEEKGMEKDIEQGIEQGKIRRNEQIVKRMHQKGFTMKQIGDATGIRKEEIENVLGKEGVI